jgi:glucokinase
MPEPWILVADIGGTNARFAAVPKSTGRAGKPLVLAVREHADFDAALAAAVRGLGGAAGLAGAVLAVAAPVEAEKPVTLTNAGWWTIDPEAVRRFLGIGKVRLINDFTAQALALPHLTAAETFVLQKGTTEARGALAVIGPGTGLGVSGLLPLPEDGWLPVEGEGGHASYAPENEIEWRVAEALRAKHGRVSTERVVSGPGLVEVAAILGARAATPAEVVAAAQAGDPACVRAMRVFLAGLGRAAGDLALILGATGGTFIGGGILPRLTGNWDLSPLVAAFRAKGRNLGRMERMPLAVIVADNPALIGLAAVARRML